MPTRKVIIAIEGNIGVGKSTVLNNLKAHFSGDARVAFVDEPVGVWEEHNLLEAMYTNRISRCSFQLMALTTRYGSLLSTLASSSAELIITERSIFSDRGCFAAVNLEAGSEDHAAYAVAHDALCEAMPAGLHHATVLLDAPRSTVQSRIAQRGRAAEKTDDADDADSNVGVPEPYLAALDEAHAAYFETRAPRARRRIDASATPDIVCAAVLAAVASLERCALADDKENAGASSSSAGGTAPVATRIAAPIAVPAVPSVSAAMAAAADELEPVLPPSPAVRSPVSIMSSEPSGSLDSPARAWPAPLAKDAAAATGAPQADAAAKATPRSPGATPMPSLLSGGMGSPSAR